MDAVKLDPKGIQQARARAEWELGDSSWADVILTAYFNPDDDAETLEMDMEV